MTYELDQAHKEYKRLIPEIIDPLKDKYPSCPLHTVRLYQPKFHDYSMANADTPGVISLNAFWFTQRPKALQDAALEGYAVLVDGGSVLWHGMMLEEPRHVLTHEFGHVITAIIPHWKKWANNKWRLATQDSDSAITGYSIANPSEYWAEAFAAYELGLDDSIKEVLA